MAGMVLRMNFIFGYMTRLLAKMCDIVVWLVMNRMKSLIRVDMIVVVETGLIFGKDWAFLLQMMTFFYILFYSFQKLTNLFIS